MTYHPNSLLPLSKNMQKLMSPLEQAHGDFWGSPISSRKVGRQGSDMACLGIVALCILSSFPCHAIPHEVKAWHVHGDISNLEEEDMGQLCCHPQAGRGEKSSPSLHEFQTCFLHFRQGVGGGRHLGGGLTSFSPLHTWWEFGNWALSFPPSAPTTHSLYCACTCLFP